MSVTTDIRDLPAPEKMNRIYRLQRFIYNPTRRYYLLGRIPLIERLDAPPGGSVLEIGAGTGWNLCRAARQYPNATFFGLEVSTEMLSTARKAVSRAGLGGQIRLARGNALDFNAQAIFGVPAFERILIAYTLSMITPGWEHALGKAADALAPGGSIHICDFGPCRGLTALFRRALYAWLAHFHVTPVANLRARLSAFCGKRGLVLDYAERNCGYTVIASLRKPA